jgi:hypothetical protein
LLTVMVCTAARQDRDGAKTVLLWTYLTTPVRFVFADGGFAGRLPEWAQTFLCTTIEVVRKPAGQRGLAVIPRRWVVERSLGWLTAHRRLARDPAISEAMTRRAAINTMTRRLARGGPATRQQRHLHTRQGDLLKHVLSGRPHIGRPAVRAGELRGGLNRPRARDPVVRRELPRLTSDTPQSVGRGQCYRRAQRMQVAPYR